MTSTALEQATLTDLEARIERGLETFVDVGLALMEIRDRRMYRELGHDRFEDYCRERWDFSDRRARQLIDASAVVGVLGDGQTGTMVPPKSERQARELAPLAKQDPDAAREAWQDANEKAEAEGREPTAKDVKAAAAEKAGPTDDQRREVAEMAARNPTASDAFIAKRVGVSEQTVAKIRDEVEADETVDAVIKGGDRTKARKYATKWFDEVTRMGKFYQFDNVDPLVEHINQKEWEAVEAALASATDHIEKVRRARSGLRVVKGGAS